MNPTSLSQGEERVGAAGVVIGDAFSLSLNGLLIYISLDQFILKVYVVVSQLQVWGRPHEKLVDWLLQACVSLPSGIPFTAVFIAVSLVVWIKARGRSAVRQRFSRHALLVTLILVFVFGCHMAFTYFIGTLPPELG
jgi:hypothetical protein